MLVATVAVETKFIGCWEREKNLQIYFGTLKEDLTLKVLHLQVSYRKIRLHIVKKFMQ